MNNRTTAFAKKRPDTYWEEQVKQIFSTPVKPWPSRNHQMPALTEEELQQIFSTPVKPLRSRDYEYPALTEAELQQIFSTLVKPYQADHDRATSVDIGREHFSDRKKRR